MLNLREEIEAYLATFHEGSDHQRYHLENFMRWREAQSKKENCQLEPWVEKELDDFKAKHHDAHPLDVDMSVAKEQQINRDESALVMCVCELVLDAMAGVPIKSMHDTKTKDELDEYVEFAESIERLHDKHQNSIGFDKGGKNG